MPTRLVEFPNARAELLRGVLTGYWTARHCVLMLPGYERAASTEPKFKRLADKLDKSGIASLRLDYSGCGLSDGDFSENTVVSFSDDVVRALKCLRKRGFKKFCVVAHSLSACIVAHLYATQEIEFDRIVLIAPALDQRALQRYWFVRNTMRRKNRLFRVTWQNYETFLDEQEFADDCARTDKMTSKNFVGGAFFPENKERNYQDDFRPLAGKTLLVHGEHDDIVPIESLGIEFPQRCVIPRGDHELERPDMISVWLPHAADYLTL
ncbi:MAG: alpha/beta fold hydrolase [bacterium]|nr:alpha/beta fold hydrolase [bacterium]